MILRYILFWFILMVVAIANGMIREAFFAIPFGELTAHQISTVTGILFILVVVWGLHRKFKIESQTQAIYIG